MAFTAPAAFTTRPTLTGSFGMTASTHWIATGVAQGVLERDGNAFDAVVAGGFALHLVEPHLNGPGGDLVGIFQTADAAGPTVLMGQGPAPAALGAPPFFAAATPRRSLQGHHRYRQPAQQAPDHGPPFFLGWQSWLERMEADSAELRAELAAG